MLRKIIFSFEKKNLLLLAEYSLIYVLKEREDTCNVWESVKKNFAVAAGVENCVKLPYL